MRSLIITMIVFGVLPFILTRPYVGVYVGAWIGYMNPHRLTYGFAYDFPFAMIIAIVTLAAIIFTKSEKSIPVNSLTVFWAGFLCWIVITTAFALNMDYAPAQLIKVIKIQTLTILAVMLIRNIRQLNVLIVVIALSIGFFGIKGGAFTLATAGNYRVWGPPGSFIEGNNELAVALLMILPLFFYFRRLLNKAWMKVSVDISALLIFASILGSQSRGAFLAILAVALFLILKSKKHRFIILISVILALPVAFSLMPENWHDRMNTIQTYEEDASAVGRMEAWEASFNIAAARVTGGGFDPWIQRIFNEYTPGYKARAAHSIYFHIMAEHGFLGLILFMMVFILAWRMAGKVIRVTESSSDLENINFLARMLQISFIAFAVGGAFLSLPYFDLPWHIVAIVLILNRIVSEKLENEKCKHSTSN